eukprot:5590263-Pleurochrysis_carterae.AAC.1
MLVPNVMILKQAALLAATRGQGRSIQNLASSVEEALGFGHLFHFSFGTLKGKAVPGNQPIIQIGAVN